MQSSPGTPLGSHRAGFWEGPWSAFRDQSQAGAPEQSQQGSRRLQFLSYLDADARAQAAGTRFERDLVIGAGATLGAGASLQRVVVWEDERVPEGLRASDGVFAGGAFHPCTPAGPVRGDA